MRFPKHSLHYNYKIYILITSWTTYVYVFRVTMCHTIYMLASFAKYWKKIAIKYAFHSNKYLLSKFVCLWKHQTYPAFAVICIKKIHSQRFVYIQSITKKKIFLVGELVHFPCCLFTLYGNWLLGARLEYSQGCQSKIL